MHEFIIFNVHKYIKCQNIAVPQQNCRSEAHPETSCQINVANSHETDGRDQRVG